MPSSLRRLLFDRLVLTLGLLLGASQALVATWCSHVFLAREAPGPVAGILLALLLVVANGMLVPALRRARRSRDWRGLLARAYSGLGVATLLAGVLLAGLWLLFLPVWGVLALVGVDPDLPFLVFRIVSIALVGALALSLSWGATFGQARIARTRVRVEIPGLHPDHRGLRIVQISDLHIGNRLEGQRLARMLEHTNALDPDVIAVTGDIFDFDPDHVEEGCRRLAVLKARYGVYAILGNHDAYTGTDLIVSALRRLAPNVTLLRDEVVRLPLERPLYLAGVEDPGHDWSARGLELDGLAVVAEARPDDGPVLLLVHRPQVFPQAERLGFPLVLAGHTHGGQLALPTPGGRYNLARIMTRYTRGLYRVNGTTLYVNRGLGVGGPALRVNCSREIATIELHPGPSGAGTEPAQSSFSSTSTSR